ncbi:MAG: VWA domain-containing protein [Magnetospirillum sp.]|nr:VWA domain-containing protein [Magnetospirillum sp.]
MLEWLELEERVGSLWHRMVGEAASYPRHPEAAVALDSVRGRLSVVFRGLGGDGGVEIAAASARSSGHRLSLRQRIGMEAERVLVARRDDATLSLPPVIDLFPAAELNRDLYVWLAAFFTVLDPAPERPAGLAADLDRLARAIRATATVLDCFPGLRPRYHALATATLAVRPYRRLVGTELRVEQAVAALLGGPALAPAHPFACVADGFLPTILPDAPRYKPFLPVPLWGEAVARAPGDGVPTDEDDATGGKGAAEDGDDNSRRRATRRRQDQADRKDPLILNRFEKILAFADMVNVNRAADDTDEDEARKAAGDMEEIVLSRHGRKAATRLKFDLDLPPGAVDPARITGTHLYPEWDWRRGDYLRDHCSVLTATAAEEGEDWTPDDATRRRIRTVRRQFEALRTRPRLLRAQAEGDDLDTEALVRDRTDFAAGGAGSGRVYLERRKVERDLSVAVLVDASLSTDAWVENRRVLDVEKEALSVFASGLAACGDEFAVLSFTSRRRDWVRVETVKDFAEPFGPAVLRRIAALRPGYYTRIGTALRHAAACLEARPHRYKLLLLLTDGKPNDVDHYEGRHGIEDTRRAVLEARAKGLGVFAVTIDRHAQGYFPHLFGRGAFAIVDRLDRLSSALPRIYRHITQA